MIAATRQAFNSTLDALDACAAMLGDAECVDDLREQTERARDMLRDALESLEFVLINVESDAE